ncbi:MAG: hypothetical protein SGPRY_006095 [Prymnesium sp.]
MAWSRALLAYRAALLLQRGMDETLRIIMGAHAPSPCCIDEACMPDRCEQAEHGLSDATELHTSAPLDITSGTEHMDPPGPRQPRGMGHARSPACHRVGEGTGTRSPSNPIGKVAAQHLLDGEGVLPEKFDARFRHVGEETSAHCRLLYITVARCAL